MLKSSAQQAAQAANVSLKSITSSDEPALYIEFETKDRSIMAFPYSQLVSYSIDAEQKQMVFDFSTHTVAITGLNLDRLRALLNEAKLRTLTECDSRYSELSGSRPYITGILVKTTSLS